MNWGRAKTILIILFLSIDVLLLCMLYVESSDVNYIKDKTAEQTAAVLNSHNISISKKQIPLKRIDKTVLFYKNPAGEPETAAKLLFENDYKTILEEGSSTYKKGTETVKIDGMKIFYENSRKTSPCDSFDEVKKAVFSDLERFGFKENQISIENARVKNGVCVAELKQKHEGLKVCGTEMTLEADSLGIKKLNGRWFNLERTENTSEKLPDVTSLLVNMIYNPDYHGLEIEEIEIIYYIDSEYIDGAEIYAYPVYVVKGTDKKQYILEEY